MPAATFSNSSAPWASSVPRSISAAWTPSSPRGTNVARPTPTTANAVTGSVFPLRSNASGSLHPKSGSTRRLVASPTSTVPGEAAPCNRAATLTASPRAAYSTRPPPPISPTTTRPVWTPTRTPNPATSHPRSTSPAYSSISSRTRIAARTARSGSSSCAVGAPKSASTPSPARSLIVPPNDSTAVMIRAIASPTISFSSSGSSRSASAVDPTRSANTAVTTRRSSRVDPSEPLMASILPPSAGLQATSDASARASASIASPSARRSDQADGIAPRPWRAPSRAPATAAFVSVSPPSPTT